VNWKQGATVVSTSPSYNLTLTNHTTLTANFVATNRTITATAAPLAGGSVTGAGVYGNGASATLTAIPSTGYGFSNWTLGGASAGTNNPVTFDALADYAFVANFAAVPPPVTPPNLLLLREANILFVTWPESATGWVLQESPDISPASWVDSALTVTTNGGQKQVSITNPAGNRFFRLKYP
jgi:hypothetical protein